MVYRKKRVKKEEESSEEDQEELKESSTLSKIEIPKMTMKTRQRSSRFVDKQILPIKRSYLDRDEEEEFNNESLRRISLKA